MDLKQHILRAAAFSHATWGPGHRTNGVVEHIRKELDEVLQAEGDYERTQEWVDVFILALDGLQRSVSYLPNGKRASDVEWIADTICEAIKNKQDRNEAREWPNWRDFGQDQAIEHDRSKDEVV